MSPATGSTGGPTTPTTCRGLWAAAQVNPNTSARSCTSGRLKCSKGRVPSLCTQLLICPWALAELKGLFPGHCCRLLGSPAALPLLGVSSGVASVRSVVLQQENPPGPHSPSVPQPSLKPRCPPFLLLFRPPPSLRGTPALLDDLHHKAVGFCHVFSCAGGEGSVLAAACSVIGVGSDIGGSIRMPAFFNGVFGHKPTTGVVPNDGQFPNALGVRSSFLCTGPMCRYAEDLEPVLRVMAGPGVSKLKLNEKVSLEKIKFHCMDHDGGSVFVSPVDKEILQAQKKVVEHLESDLGVQVQRVAIHKMKYSFQIWSAMMSSKDSEGQEAQRFTDLLGDHGKPVWPLWELMKWFVGMSSHTLPAIALGLTEKVVNLNLSGKAKLVSMGKSLQEEMEALLGPDGVLLYPSHPTIAPKHHSPICMPFNFAYTAIFNVLGLPVTQCPLGLGSEGLPLGIQLVAAAYNDHLTLAVARYLEKAFGGWVLPGKV
ncbi:hypothetical protein Nmel_013318 [Mimus melanotis]